MTRTNGPTIDEQRSFWDAHWHDGGQARRVVNDWALARFDAILELVRSLGLTSPRILDLGCGPGYYSERLAQFGKVTGVDLSETAVDRARARAQHVTFMAGNILEMPLPQEHFDLVVSQEVLAHCEDQERYLQRAAEVLRPNGYLILSTDNKFVMDRRTDQSDPLPSSHIDHFLTIRELRRLLRPRFEVLRLLTRLPMGNRGVLRLVNSEKLNRALGRVVARPRLTRLKERLGLGMTIIVLARRRASRTVPGGQRKS